MDVPLFINMDYFIGRSHSTLRKPHSTEH